jgi:hypothetical protein
MPVFVLEAFPKSWLIWFQAGPGNVATSVPAALVTAPNLAGLEPVIGIAEAKHMYENGVFNW